MSSTGQPPSVPRWVWEVIAVLVIIAVAAIVVAVVASRGNDSATGSPPLPSPPPATTATTATGTTAPATSTSAAPTVADGCVGGPTELDQAVLTAQKQSPLTQVGAASFAASLARWAFAAPPPPFQQRTARQILAPKATAAAKNWLSSARDLKGSTGTIDFATGKYYIEAFEGRTAVVSIVAAAHVADKGTPQPEVRVATSLYLRAVNGGWRLENKSDQRSIPDLDRIGVAYTDGC